MRLGKYLANMGVASRRKVPEVVAAKKVLVNGVVVSDLSFEVKEGDEVKVGGKVIGNQKHEYWLVNKPAGVLSAVEDDRGRMTVVDLIEAKIKVYPVGRLDLNSRGLMLLTNDGELTYRLTHPKYEVAKTYLVVIRGHVREKDIVQMENGIEIDRDIVTGKIEVTIEWEKGNKTKLRMILKEGKKREIRRICEVFGWQVLDLQRISLGNLKLGNIKEGNSRRLTEEEARGLKEMVGLET